MLSQHSQCNNVSVLGCKGIQLPYRFAALQIASWLQNVRASNFHVGFAYKLHAGFAYKTQVGCKNVIFTFDSILQFHFRRVTDIAGFLQKESLKKPCWISVTRTTFSLDPCQELIG